jgi:hypothetical protein
MNELKQHIKHYRQIDDEIRELNSQVSEKRNERKAVELDIADIIKSPEYAAIKKIKLEEDGSTISFKRPNEWNKPWSISQRELKELLIEYFEPPRPGSGTDVFDFIVARRKEKLVATEFSFSRTVPGEMEE